jgi:outer membrane lipoprotein SlyB
MRSKAIVSFSLMMIIAVGSGCSTPLSKREQGGLIGGGVGAGTGAIIGSTVGHAAVGALIGGPVGLIAGALIGDQLMAQDRRQDAQQQIDQNQAELRRLQRENEQLRENQGTKKCLLIAIWSPAQCAASDTEEKES